MTVQPPDDEQTTNDEYVSVYETIYSMAYVELEDNTAYNLEELALEVV